MDFSEAVKLYPSYFDATSLLRWCYSEMYSCQINFWSMGEMEIEITGFGNNKEGKPFHFYRKRAGSFEDTLNEIKEEHEEWLKK